jgi:hypothetical protein
VSSLHSHSLSVASRTSVASEWSSASVVGVKAPGRVHAALEVNEGPARCNRNGVETVEDEPETGEENGRLRAHTHKHPADGSRFSALESTTYGTLGGANRKDDCALTHSASPPILMAVRGAFEHHDVLEPFVCRPALRSEGEDKGAHAGVARDERQHVPLSRGTGDQANHAGSIKASHSIGADVWAMGGAD